MPATTMMHDSLLSLCKVSGAGCVLGFCRVFADSLARVMCLGSAESLPSLWRGLCAWLLPSLRRVSGLGCVLRFCRVFADRIQNFSSRSSRAWQPLLAPLSAMILPNFNLHPRFNVGSR